MLATVQSATLVGIESVPVEVQAFFDRGLPDLEIVGLGDAAVRESRVRVRSALTSSGLELPNKHVVLNLAPADVRKTGSALDLAIGVALLCASGVATPARLAGVLVLGELSLNGDLRGVRGVLPHLRSARARGFTQAIVPLENGHEAALVGELDVRVATNLRDVFDYLLGALELRRAQLSEHEHACAPAPDLSDVRGQQAAKRALEVAAAGAHNLLMVGPPGTGKTMLAQRIAGLLPSTSEAEALEIAIIASAAGAPPPARLGEVQRPFRAPHHSASFAALVGGGAPIRPGEVTLAHNGVLFLDELPEFQRSTLEALRPTMESGVAAVARARERVQWPARPLMIAAMNPCPCGYLDDPRHLCLCGIDRIERYRGRLSGPLLDRFDMHIALRPVEARVLREGDRGESSAVVRARVELARRRARKRKKSELGLEGLAKQACAVALSLLDRSVDALGLSVRAYVKCLRVARTIADLACSDRIEADHMAEAIQYRLLDRLQKPLHIEPNATRTIETATSEGTPD
jgi:magnesium chelatase family protein